MKTKNLLGLAAALAATLVVHSANAFTDVCTLATTEVPGSIRVSSLELASYKEKMKSECELSEKYQQMVLKARKFGITLEHISEYQALRYVDRNFYEGARASNTPVPVIYQLLKSDYSKDWAQRSSIIWDGFTIGARQLESERARIAAGGRLELQDISRLQRGFYTLSDEAGDFSHAHSPGVMKPAAPNDRHWWRLKPEEVDRTKAIVADVNETFASYGFIKSGLAGLYGDVFQNEIISVRQTEDGGMGLYGGDSRANQAHLQNWLKLFNGALAQARAGQHMAWNNRLVTPAEVALLSQQLFVDIHPFTEGNGRTSRLVQEIVLTLFGMPHGSSGDLMENDVLTRQGEYYTQAITKTKALLASVDQCLETGYNEEAKSSGAKSERSSKGQSSSRVAEPVNAASLNQSTLAYNCRILK